MVYYPTSASKIPAATADPRTPATFGPIACISKKFCGFASKPTLFTTRAAIGTAALAFTPPGQLAIGMYCTWKLISFGAKLIKKFA